MADFLSRAIIQVLLWITITLQIGKIYTSYLISYVDSFPLPSKTMNLEM